MKLNKIKNGLSYALEYIHDKICNNSGKIIVISILLLFCSMMISIAFIVGVKNPNLGSYHMYPSSFNYTDYNKDIEKNNIENNVDINYGKIGYIMRASDENDKYMYKLVFSDYNHKDDCVYIYPTAEQLKQLEKIKDSHTPILVIAKVTDSINSDCYNIEIKNVEDNTEEYNQTKLKSQYAMIAVVLSALIFVVTVIVCII
jgi:hypothetical protein